MPKAKLGYYTLGLADNARAAMRAAGREGGLIRDWGLVMRSVGSTAFISAIAGLGLVASVSQGQAPTFSIEVSALNGSPINPRVSGLVVEPTDEVTAEVFIRNWSGGTAAPLNAYQFSLDPASYTSGTSGNVYPKDFATTTDVNGRCTAAGAVGNENPGNAMVQTGRSDFVHFGMSPFTSVDTLSCGYRAGSAVAVDGPVSQSGVKKYCGTVVLKVSADALGTFTIMLNPAPSATALWRSSGTMLGPASFEHLSLQVVPSADLNILAATPPTGAIDARQPVRPDGTGAAGFNLVDLVFNKSTSSLSPADFAITVDPAGGTVPAIQTLVPSGNNVRITLNSFIPTGKWTIFNHQDSTPTSARLGFLPGDITGNGQVDAATDVPRLLLGLGGTFLEQWQSDIDRDGALTLLDLPALMNVLIGAGSIDPWAGRTLP